MVFAIYIYIYICIYVYIYNRYNLVRKPTCFKNPKNPPCKICFWKIRQVLCRIQLIKTRLSDFHKMITIIRYITRTESKNYPTHKLLFFWVESFKIELDIDLLGIDIYIMSNFLTSVGYFISSWQACTKTNKNMFEQTIPTLSIRIYRKP